MRIKLDENIPSSLADDLTSLGYVTDTFHTEGLTGANDDTVWSAAQSEQRFFVTQDLDFSDVRRFLPRQHSGTLLVRLRDPSRRELIDFIQTTFRTEDVRNWEGCFVVMTDRKTRVRRPTS